MQEFNADEYWKDKKYKCFVVYLSVGSGKKICTSKINVQARNEERAVHVAKLNSMLKGNVQGFARLAEPRDFGIR